MATYKELQDRVLRRVVDAPSSVTTEVPTLVNAAIRKLEVVHNFRVMQAVASFTTTEATRSLGAIPSDWKEPREQPPYLVDNDGNAIELKWLPTRADVLRQFSDSNSDDAGQPLALFVGREDEDGAGSIEVYPLPDGASDYADGDYRVKVPYWRYLPDLSADGDSNWFTVNAAEFIVADATAEAFYLDWDEKRAQMWEQRAWGPLYAARGLIGGFAARVLKLDKHGRLAATNTLIPRRDVFAIRDQTRT